ncbi:ABC transporter ATP-binding protein [Labilibacter sediminis]|nr:ABC transporter ATP-binding protein [Labilibacter sediminis]
MMDMQKKTDTEVLLNVVDLAVGYDRKEKALHQDINVSVNKGEFVCLLGPNGAGKSTLIKTLSGFLKPLSGDICFGDIRLQDLTERQRAKRVSVVLTDKLQVQNLTVFELVSLGRTPYTGYFGKLTDHDKALVLRAIQEVGLGGFTHHYIDKMSDGERQKAMIAKALVQETPFIILDEPTAFLDLPAKIEIMQLLRKLSRESKRGILLSTHDLDMALQTADKIWLLAQGKSMQQGIPEDLVLSNDFKSFFERDGVYFDNNTGSFKYHSGNRIEVTLKGSGIAHEWVARALYRLGYKPVAKNSDWLIEVSSNGSHSFSLYKQSKLLATCENIQELMQKITESM